LDITQHLFTIFSP